MIHPIEIEIPWPVAPVNVYLVNDEPLTLVDTGANLASSLPQLERGLADYEKRVEDIERVVVTHQHIEHLGLASVIAERSGAEVCAISGLKGFFADQPRSDRLEDDFEDALMLRHGVPGPVIEQVRRDEPGQDGWDASAAVDVELREGDRLEFRDRTWEVLLHPGHSPYDTLYYDARRGDLFAGDHLLAKISSNPLITFGDGATLESPPRSLEAYRNSLGRTRELEVDTVWPGHGPPISDHRGLIDRRLGKMDKRSTHMRREIEKGPATGHEIAIGIWGPSLARAEPYLTLSEVLGHLAELTDAGSVEEIESGGRVHFEPRA